MYDLESFAAARTHDPLWNAAQTQLAREARVHNYMRMLWGKKILEWTRSHEDALDGRNPNFYSGIFCVIGR